MTDKENIISKIQKLLNVSKENGASENEAMVAAERAQKLLSEHKLSLKDVEHKEETIQFFEEIVPHNHKWKDAVYHATAKLYFCKTYQSTKFDENYKKVKVIKFAGRESNKIVALEMTKYFIDTCERLAEQEFKSVIGNKTQINSMKRNYLIGCSNRLAHRINDKWMEIVGKEEDQPKLPGSGLPMLYKDEFGLIDMFLKENGVHIVAVKSRTSIRDRVAYGRGKAAGNGINLSTQISGKSKARLLSQ